MGKQMFQLSESQIALQTEAGRLARQEFAPLAEQVDESEAYP